MAVDRDGIVVAKNYVSTSLLIINDKGGLSVFISTAFNIGSTCHHPLVVKPQSEENICGKELLPKLNII